MQSSVIKLRGPAASSELVEMRGITLAEGGREGAGLPAIKCWHAGTWYPDILIFWYLNIEYIARDFSHLPGRGRRERDPGVKARCYIQLPDPGGSK